MSAVTRRSGDNVRIGHPSGVIEVDVRSEADADGPVFHRLGVARTARVLMEGFVYVPDRQPCG
jgi:2-methylaconitate cis-trans-isomerase PrpF